MKRGIVTLKRAAGRNAATMHLAVPAALVKRHDLKAGMLFAPEVTDDGILYRPVENYPARDNRPKWRR